MNSPTRGLCDFVLPEAVVPGLRAARSDDVIAELVEAVSPALALSAELAKRITQEILLREAQGTSAMGRGIALPHLKHAGVRHIVFAIGRSVRGVSFSALDRKPVHLFALALAPMPASPEYPALLGKMLGLLQDRHIRDQLLSARTRDEMLEVLRDADRGKPK